MIWPVEFEAGLGLIPVCWLLWLDVVVVWWEQLEARGRLHR